MTIDSLLEDATKPLTAPLEKYNEFALRYRCEVSDNGYPWQAAIDLPEGYHLDVRGLTTVFNSDRDDLDGSLVVGATQTVLLREDASAVHLLLAHHGPEDCRDRVEIRDRIRGRAYAMLCGHRHDQRVQKVDQCVEVIAGAVHPEEDPGWYPTYNWLTFDVTQTPDGPPTLIIDVYQRTRQPAWNEFRSGIGTPGPQRYTELLPPLDAQTASTASGQTVRDGTKRPAGLAEVAAASQVLPDSQVLSESSASNETPASLVSPLLTNTGVHVEGGPVDPPPSTDARPPMLDGKGEVNMERRLTKDLLDLPVPDQEAVLIAADLLTDEDMHRSHITMIINALARLSDDASKHRLATEIRNYQERGNA